MFRSSARWPVDFRVLRSSQVHARPPRRARHHTFRCLPLEQLEERSVPSVVTFTVRSLADSGGGTLREAITTADTGAATNSYVINIVTPGTITLESALPDLSRNITITGLGASNSTVQRDSFAPGFRIFTVDAGETVNISGLTIARGNAGNGSGGGLDNSGTLTVSNSVFSSNSATFGGGLANESGGTATVSGSSFTSNSAGFDGGGLGNDRDGDGERQLLHQQLRHLRRRPHQLRDGDGERQHLHRQLRHDGGGLVNGGTATVSDSSFTSNSASLRRRPRQRRDGDGERQLLHQQLRQHIGGGLVNAGRRR